MTAQLVRSLLLGLNLIIPAQSYAVPTESMPEEYTTIMRVVSRIAAANDLGTRPLVFTIIPGTAAIELAQSMGLCKRDDCNYYGQLNPFKKYDPKTDEILRQSYLAGDIGSWANSNGTIEISRPSFRLYSGNDNYFLCTLAHEISHIIDGHQFSHTLLVSKEMQGKRKEEQRRIYLAYNRHFEKIADQRAHEMSIRSGQPKETCLDGVLFLHRASGDGSITQPESTHPGFEERWEALKEYIESAAAEKIKRPARTSGHWDFNPELNYLLFKPSSR